MAKLVVHNRPTNAASIVRGQRGLQREYILVLIYAIMEPKRIILCDLCCVPYVSLSEAYGRT